MPQQLTTEYDIDLRQYLDGAQGFLQVWFPTEMENSALVTLTNGEYDGQAVVEQTRDRSLETMQ